MKIKLKIESLLRKHNIQINDNKKQPKEVGIVKNQIIKHITEYMSNLNSALIPCQKINDGFINGVTSVEQLKSLHITNILISFLSDDYVEITKLDSNKQALAKISSLKDYYLDKRGEFIDEHDLPLYCNDKTGQVEFIAEVYNDNYKGYINDAHIGIVACLYNKRSKTHLVQSTGLVFISTGKICHLDKLNEISKYKPWDYIKVTGKLRTVNIKDNAYFIDIPYIEASNITLSTKQARDEVIKR